MLNYEISQNKQMKLKYSQNESVSENIFLFYYLKQKLLKY